MTAAADIATRVSAQASLEVQACVLARAEWGTEVGSDGRRSFRPQKGTWYGHVVRGRSRWDVTVVPMIGCPSCGGLLMLSHEQAAAKALRKMTGMPVPVSHGINYLGKVTPDVLCMHGRCDFHRKVYLDRWNKTKPLFALAYINKDKGDNGEIEIAYSHSIDTREALFHLGRGNFSIIAGGPAIGFFVNEKTGRVTAEMK